MFLLSNSKQVTARCSTVLVLEVSESAREYHLTSIETAPAPLAATNSKTPSVKSQPGQIRASNVTSAYDVSPGIMFDHFVRVCVVIKQLSGGHSEFDKVKAFIANRSKKGRLSDRIHVIWYCISMDEDGRSFTEAEVKFFSHCDTGSMIVLFTKFDALYDDEFAELISNGVLRKDDADCGLLIKRTAAILDDDTLKQMFVSTQRTNLKLCMRYAVELSLAKHLDFTQTISTRMFGKSDRQIIYNLGGWFPHTSDYDYWDGVSVLIICGARASLTEHVAANPMIGFVWWYSASLTDPVADPLTDYFVYTILISKVCQTSESSALEKIMQLGSAAVIIFENAFYLSDQQRHGLERKSSVHPVRVALRQYIASPNAAAVREALSSAIHTYETGSSRWITGSVTHSQKKAELIEIIMKQGLKSKQGS
ncbi:hypothetical protein EDD22DRAFT_849811, partial [Suillus occidentalis]